MTTPSDAIELTLDWRQRAHKLAESLVARSILRSEEWREAVQETPRHLFVPFSAVANGQPVGADTDIADIGVQNVWLDRVYSDETIVVQRRPHVSDGGTEEIWLPTSSSTMPSLMVDMLEALDVAHGQRVLEIGTGTGYNAALLCHRLGSDNVVSIDIDPRLVRNAHTPLERLGYAPTLIAGDGLDGAPQYGPYDRIIATCAVPYVPQAWISQLAPGGSMLINLRGDITGVLCLLTKHSNDDEVIGPVIRDGGNFMWLRQSVDNPLRDNESTPTIHARNVARRFTSVPPGFILENPHFGWLLQLELPGLRIVSATEVFDPVAKNSAPGLLLYGQDGTHAQAFLAAEKNGLHRVIQGGGPGRLWDTVETAYHTWQQTNHPDPRRFGVVANLTTQFAWLDDDMSWLRWPLNFPRRSEPAPTS
jgi:protein-L-isoaspartate O-methyltransferase